MDDFNLILECDGRQHFTQVANWTNPEYTQKMDKYKMKCANEHGYSVIRIFQEDIWNNKNNWEDNLKMSIRKYNNPTNILIGNQYKLFMLDDLSHCLVY